MSNTDQNPEDQTPDNVEPLAQADNTGLSIDGLKAALEQTQDKMMRALAEAENTRKRAIKDREDAGKFAVSSFARDMLDFGDNFSRALAAIPDDLKTDPKIAPIAEGIAAMERDILKVFERHGIKKLEPLGEPFNPNFHEVMFEVPAPGQPAGKVIQVVEPGYTLNGRLLRAAKVGVSKADDGQAPEGQHIDEQA